jgi:septum site-determining protein MinD
MTKFIAVVSGKGGVGKTTSAINVGYALHNLGYRVTLLDANFASAHLSTNLGVLNPKNTLNQFLEKKKQLLEIIHTHQSGLSIIPASPSYQEAQKRHNITEIFEHLDDLADFVIVDSPSGLKEVEEVLKNSDEALVVVNPTLSSVMDGLKTMRAAKENDTMISGIILNMVHGKNELKKDQVESILGRAIISEIKYDQKIRKSVHKGFPLNYYYPRSRSAKQFNKVAELLIQ